MPLLAKLNRIEVYTHAGPATFTLDISGEIGPRTTAQIQEIQELLGGSGTPPDVWVSARRNPSIQEIPSSELLAELAERVGST